MDNTTNDAGNIVETTETASKGDNNAQQRDRKKEYYKANGKSIKMQKQIDALEERYTSESQQDDPHDFEEDQVKYVRKLAKKEAMKAYKDIQVQEAQDKYVQQEENLLLDHYPQAADMLDDIHELKGTKWMGKLSMKKIYERFFYEWDPVPQQQAETKATASVGVWQYTGDESASELQAGYNRMMGRG